MNIAVLSGKGGTGKTTVSVNLAVVLSNKNKVQYLDCDVEEPNGAIFLKPEIQSSKEIFVQVPRIIDQNCIHCSECGQFCQFGAIASLPNTTLVFPELCHSCGGCKLVCKYGAIREVKRAIGVVEEGESKKINFVHGILNVKEARTPPIIEDILNRSQDEAIVVIDSPPGTACPAVASLQNAQLAVLVTEPTPFGLNDLKLAVKMLEIMEINYGVVINRSSEFDYIIEEWCGQKGVSIWGKIPVDMKIARIYSEGKIVVDELSEYREKFLEIAGKVLQEGEK